MHMSVLGLIVAMLLGAAVFGLVIYIVGKLGLGIEVSGFGAAFVAAIVIAVLSWLVTWILQALGFAFGGALCGPLVTSYSQPLFCCLPAGGSRG